MKLAAMAVKNSGMTSGRGLKKEVGSNGCEDLKIPRKKLAAMAVKRVALG